MQNQNRQEISHKEEEISVANQIKKSIQSVSKSRRFQIKLIVFFLLISFFAHFRDFGSRLFYMSPVFQCENIGYKVLEDEACQMLDFCKLSNSQTIVAQLNLYCHQKKDQRTYIQMSIGVGYWVGILFAGALSDRKGRKFCFLIGFILLNMACLFQYVGVFTKNIPLLILSQFIGGVSDKIVYLNFLVILTRFLPKSSYELGTIGWFMMGNGIAPIGIAAFNQYFQNWRNIFYIQSLGIVACSIAAYFLIWQDPIYLFDIGKLEESKLIIQAIGVENGVNFQANQANLKKIDLIFEMKMQQIQNNGQANSFKFSIKEIIRCDIITKIILIGVVGCFYTMTIKSIQLSMHHLKNSYNFNLFILGVSNICGFASAVYINRVETQRKRGLIYTSFIYGVIAFLFAFPFCYQNGNIQTLILFFLNLFLGWINNFYTRLKVDTFPQKYQITCMGIVEFLSNSGSVFGPILIQKSSDRHMNPIFAINLLRMTIGTLPLLCLSEQKTVLNKPQHQSQLPSNKKNQIIH